jgi:hypothetical protein
MGFEKKTTLYRFIELNKTKYILVGFVVLRILSVFYSKEELILKEFVTKRSGVIKIELF